ncbi:hypothetical protein JOF53_007343 [Crossiella equi]|uniref:Stress protein n=1 Tax=Crossiella equi TaxID=130796 RepID=A0ABS5API3_9PSEU|nr:hypothetical protein [Crossiella equi]MBP2478471.1 hypothetical protein [Crossiella equi]
MKIKTMLAALPLAALALLGVAASPALADTASVASVQGKRASLDVNFDTDNIGVRLGDALSKINTDNRDQFVRQAVDKAFEVAGGRYNVMLFNLSVGYQRQLQGEHFYGGVKWDGVYYGLWIFEAGHFENLGDGGYINWGFKGWFTKNVGKVDFRRP